MAEERESLSDHRYSVIFLLHAGREKRNNMPRIRLKKKKKSRENEDRNSDLTHPRWIVKTLNKDLLLATAHAVAWAAPPEETPLDAEKEAEWFQTKMAEACNAAFTALPPGRYLLVVPRAGREKTAMRLGAPEDLAGQKKKVQEPVRGGRSASQVQGSSGLPATRDKRSPEHGTS